MRSLLLLALAIPALLALQEPQAEPAPATTRGRLLAVGGGGTSDTIVARALELAGGAGARMLVVAQASNKTDAGESSAAFWREKGAREVHVLDLADRDRALAEIAKAEFLWMPGGDQNRLVEALRAADVLAAIRARHEAGALVGGTSAGAAVLSAAMIVGGDTAGLEAVRAGGTKLAQGLGLWRDAIVDQHFLKRQRFHRLLAAVLDRPELVGIGIDERTAVVLHPDGTCEVVGDGGVLVVDARAARRSPARDGEVHSASGIALAVHRPGDRFPLRPLHAR
ncbi:MAG: cyanophycinase [Planctomycetes bacterium]|nr:cyanophycinase [Planctomycetota bacterium]